MPASISDRRVRFCCKPFAELSGAEVYAILALRQDVFVVEQDCVFHEIDHADGDAHHLLGFDTGDRLVAYLRIVPPGQRFADPSIGRIVTAGRMRGRGIGRAVVREGVRQAKRLYPGRPLCMAAQAHLRGFYESEGFAVTGDAFDEDGIPHVEMVHG